MNLHATYKNTDELYEIQRNEKKEKQMIIIYIKVT